MPRENARPALLQWRKQLWDTHCASVLERLLLPSVRNQSVNSNSVNASLDRTRTSLLLVENRIDSQWLFTCLNGLLMAPPDSRLCIVADQESILEAKSLMGVNGVSLDVDWLVCSKSFDLSRVGDYNLLLKTKHFWESLPYEHILLIQKDALLIEPVPEALMDFGYLGAPFLPRSIVDLFPERTQSGDLNGFFKVNSEVHSFPHKDIYPNMGGNGGLSIRSRSLMCKIVDENQCDDLNEEPEDVFFSRNLAKYQSPAPLVVSRAFAMETEYNSISIGCHAPWKYLEGSQLAGILERHLKQVLACLQYPIF